VFVVGNPAAACQRRAASEATAKYVFVFTLKLELAMPEHEGADRVAKSREKMLADVADRANRTVESPALEIRRTPASTSIPVSAP
jgi:hypothetical protein